MVETEINARAAAEDILGGMGQRALMDKYRLKPQALEHLLKQLVGVGLLVKTKVGFRRAGSKVSKPRAMKRYGGSSTGLDMAPGELLDISSSAPPASLAVTNNSLVTGEVLFTPRSAPRYLSPLAVAVMYEKDPQRKGLVQDISVRGLSTIRLEATRDRMERLHVLGDELGAIHPFQIKAICRWARKDSEGSSLAGFEFVSISEESLWALISWLRLCMT